MIIKKNVFIHLLLIVLYLQKQCFAMNLEQAKKQLSHTKSYHIFNVLSPEEIDNLSKMKAKPESREKEIIFDESDSLENFEKFLTIMENYPQIKKSTLPILQKLFNNLSKIQNADMISGVLKFEDEHTRNRTGWHIDIPRHIFSLEEDSINAPNDESKCYRVIVNLQNEGTQFIELNPEERANFLTYLRKDPFAKNPDIVKSIWDFMPQTYQQLQPGQGVVFDAEQAVHTRPQTNKNRALMIFTFETIP